MDTKMSTKLIPLDKVLKAIEPLSCEMIADRDTLEEAQAYAVSLLRAASKDEVDMAVMVSMGVIMNTVHKLIKEAIEKE
jgi:hypothetical protein